MRFFAARIKVKTLFRNSRLDFRSIPVNEAEEKWPALYARAAKHHVRARPSFPGECCQLRGNLGNELINYAVRIDSGTCLSCERS